MVFINQLDAKTINNKVGGKCIGTDTDPIVKSYIVVAPLSINFSPTALH